MWVNSVCAGAHGCKSDHPRSYFRWTRRTVIWILCVHVHLRSGGGGTFFGPHIHLGRALGLLAE